MKEAQEKATSKTGAGTADRDEKAPNSPTKPAAEDNKPVEIGGPSGPEPTRYGDWERKGRCIDF